MNCLPLALTAILATVTMFNGGMPHVNYPFGFYLITPCHPFNQFNERRHAARIPQYLALFKSQTGPNLIFQDFSIIQPLLLSNLCFLQSSSSSSPFFSNPLFSSFLATIRMSTSKELMALAMPVPEAEEGEFDFAPLNLWSELTDMDLVLLHEQYQIPQVEILGSENRVYLPPLGRRSCYEECFGLG